MTSPIRALALLLLLLAAIGGSAPAGERERDTLKLLRSRRPEDRRGAIRVLADVPGRGALRLILTALTDEDVTVRDAAERAVRRRRAPEDLEALRDDGLSHRDPRVRVVSLRALADADAPDLEAPLAAALSDRDAGVREAAVGATFSNLGIRGVEMLAAAVHEGREGRPRAAALLAVERLDPERAWALAEEVRGFPAMEVRVAALEVLSGGDPDRALAVLSAGLADENWSVRLTAARGLVRLCRAEAVPPLVAALARERGRMREELGGALAGITGVGLPPDAKRWREWWEKEKDGFEIPERPAEAGKEDEASVATFHSIPVHSEGVAFVLDRSRSMRRSLDRDEATTKASLVEAELAKTLARLSPPARIFLVAFGTEPAAFLPRPVPATRQACARALEWFEKREPAGRTNLHDALALALAREEIDTVFVLTDGAPSAGEERTRSGILESIGRKNRYRKAVIHTVEIGGETTGKKWKGFLAELARRTGGRAVRR